MGFIHDTQDKRFGGLELETSSQSFKVYGEHLFAHMNGEHGAVVELDYRHIDALLEILALAKQRAQALGLRSGDQLPLVAEGPEVEALRITAVAIVTVWREDDSCDALLGVRPGSIAGRCGAAGDSLEDLDMPAPAGPGTWVWRDTGSTMAYPNQYDEDGGPVWRGSWIRPSDSQAIAIAGGTMPWDLQPEQSPGEAERLHLHAEVDRLRDALADARIELARATDRIADVAAERDRLWLLHYMMGGHALSSTAQRATRKPCADMNTKQP